MASAFYSNTLHIDFASVLAMEIPGIVSVLHALTDSGLEGFLGCPAVVYESELVEFFNNGSAKDGLVINTVHGVPIEISEQLLAETFELPVDGLSKLSETHKDKIYDARSIVSLLGEPVNLSGRKGQMKIEYRLLCDIIAKSISVKAGSFNALTLEKFALLTAVVCGVKMNWASVLFNIFKKMVTPGAKQAKGFVVQISLFLENFPNLNLGEYSEFPVSKILTAKTVHRYISVTDKESTHTSGQEDDILKEEIKLFSIGLGDSGGSPGSHSYTNYSCYTSCRAMVEDQQEKIVADAIAVTAGEQEPVGEQVEEQPAVESSSEEPAVEGAAEETADDISEKDDAPVVEPVMDNIVDNEVSNADDVDTISAGLSTVSIDERHWFDLSHEELIARWDAERQVATPPDTDEETAVERKIGVAEGVQVAFSQSEFTMEEQADMELNDDDKFVYEWFDADETRSLEDIMLSIPLDISLPSASMEITKIQMGKEIKIPEINERTWFLNSLPKISAETKGKAILVEKDPMKGNPAQEHYFLICADIDMLVNLRAKVIDEVAQFFNSFSLKKLATINIEEMYKKEEQVLSWGETESPQLAIQRKLYILLKYREVLVRKFLVSWRSNFVPGQGSSAVDLKVIALLSDLHLFILEELSKEARAHGLLWKKTCCSKFFYGSPADREPCADRWVKIPQLVISCEVHRQRQYDDTLPPVNIFYKTLTKRWADICLEVVDFCASRRLLTVGSLQFCGSVSVIEPVYRVALRQCPVFALRVSEFCTVFVNYSLFSSLNMEDIRNLVGSIAVERTVLKNVQSSVLAVPSAQLPSAPHQSSLIFPDDTSMHFDETDIATPVPAFSLPVSSTVSTDITRALNQMQASLDKISNRDDGAALKDTILMHLRDIEKNFTARFDAQDRWIGALRNDSNDQRNLLSLEINSSHRKLHTQITAATIDQIDMQREVKELNAKVDAIATNLERVKRDAEATKESIFHQLFEFKSQAQANHLILTTQLGLLVDGLNRGGNDKKGEGDSSRGPKPTPVRIERRPLPTPQLSPDDQGSGGIRTTTIVDRNKGHLVL
ncbi:dystroglycan-like [Dorcoceras hygrometricum]|uniref:Dystroglycan-like n=1 Tax=Dorcoceras hygrometricum TaxID=472368 RepID=A0A2Z7A9Q9_9LAMI|nr:dystroglycan-like [Dorcoceras hygrometricum]